MNVSPRNVVGRVVHDRDIEEAIALRAADTAEGGARCPRRTLGRERPGTVLVDIALSWAQRLVPCVADGDAHGLVPVSIEVLSMAAQVQGDRLTVVQTSHLLGIS